MENLQISKGLRGGLSRFKRGWRGERIGLLGAQREIVLAILSGVIPWWFGANDPPAIYLISWLIVILGVLTLIESIIQNKQSNLTWSQILLAPPVAVLGLISIFGFIQWVEIGPELLQTLSPVRYRVWEELGGKSVIVTKAGDPSFQLPARIAWLEAEVYESVVWLSSLWVLSICVLRLPGRWGPLKRHSMVMVISASLMGIQSMLQAMTFTGKILWIRQAHIVISSAGPFFVHSHLASYLNIGLGFAMAHICFMGWQGRKNDDQEYLFNEQRHGVGKGIFWVYSAGLILVSVLATGSRGGMLAMLMAMASLGAVWVVFAQRLRKIASGSMEWKWMIGLLVAVLFLMTLFTDVLAIFSRARGLVGKEGGHAAGVRRKVWALAWESWKDAPVWGTGWGSYVWASQRHFNAAVGYSTHAESDYVQILPEGGVIGFLLFLAALAGLFRYVLRVVRKVEQPNQMALVGGSIFALIAVGWGSLTENNLRTAGVAVPALITVAHLVRLSAGWHLLETKNWDQELAGKKVSVFSKVIGVSLCILLVSLAWIGKQQTRQVNWAWSLLRNADLRPAGTDQLGWIQPAVKTETLELQKQTLDLVNQFLPGWGDYQIQQAVTEVELYERQTRETLIKEGISAEDAEKLSRLIQLAVVMKSLPEAERPAARDQILQDPVVGYEIRRTLDFLAGAWQNQSISAMVHSELALMDWAFEKGPSSEESLNRALSLVGQRQELLLRIGQEAMALGHENTGMKAFAAVMAIPESVMESLAKQILPWVTPAQVDMLKYQSAEVVLNAGEYLIPLKDTERRQQFGEKALASLPPAKSLTDGNKLALVARAKWLTGAKEEAIEQLKLATAYKQSAFELREKMIDWLIDLGRTAEALEQAQATQYLWPDHPRTKHVLDKAATADAKGPGKS